MRSHPNVLTFFSPVWGMLKGLDAFRFFFKPVVNVLLLIVFPLSGRCSEGLDVIRFFFKPWCAEVLLLIQLFKETFERI